MFDVGFSRPASATPPPSSPSSASASPRYHTTRTVLDNAGEKISEEKMPVGLSTLPFDLLLNIALFLDHRDVHALQLTCRSLYEASTTRPVYRKLANDLLRRCRALPLKGFQRLSDLSTEALIHAVNKATHYENAWRRRSPQPIASERYNPSGINSRSNYMDVLPSGRLAEEVKREGRHKWYKIVSAPPGEEVDWLSPITSSYTLCATKSGKVVCWDVQSDECLAEWNPGARWELWKCRVEFEERTVFFTMAKVLSGSYDDERVMEFVLMKLTFSDGPSGESSPNPPVFSHVTDFRTAGVVMNVFLLDPSERLLSAFIWVSTSNTIGLYALPDWSKREYVFIDTGIECVMSSNWSCILYQNNIVIHCEEADAAYQHFYPLSLLRTFTTQLPADDGSVSFIPGTRQTQNTATPVISRRVPPARTLKKKFVFPAIPHEHIKMHIHDMSDDDDDEDDSEDEMTIASVIVNGPPSTTSSSATATAADLGSSNIPILNGNGSALAGPSNSQTSSTTSSSTSSTTSSSPSSSTAASSSTSSTTSSLLLPLPAPSLPNPFPFPPWYPESAHFVRQWWPSLPSIPRVSCTVVLLATHDATTHKTRFVLAQHYFRVPIDWKKWCEGELDGLADVKKGKEQENGVNGFVNPDHLLASRSDEDEAKESARDDALMHLWYVSKPFDVMRVFDVPSALPDDELFGDGVGAGGDANGGGTDGAGATGGATAVLVDDEAQIMDRPRPLVAVDFGHAVWIEYLHDEDSDSVSDVERRRRSARRSRFHYSPGLDGDEDDEDDEEIFDARRFSRSQEDDGPKVLRFVTFPPFSEEYGVEIPQDVQDSSSLANGHTGGKGKGRAASADPADGAAGPWEGQVRTLETPPELDLGEVETINIDQSQGAVILSDRKGRIFILCYE